ncbi:hypothetical protein [Teichococcus aestuarii]|uniref:hypothetical protein n=1 Tax=Teichococcus aestuarii TaxID=568898 RepID=UPI0036150EC1
MPEELAHPAPEAMELGAIFAALADPLRRRWCSPWRPSRGPSSPAAASRCRWPRPRAPTISACCARRG